MILTNFERAVASENPLKWCDEIFCVYGLFRMRLYKVTVYSVDWLITLSLLFFVAEQKHYWQ